MPGDTVKFPKYDVWSYPSALCGVFFSFLSFPLALISVLSLFRGRMITIYNF